MRLDMAPWSTMFAGFRVVKRIKLYAGHQSRWILVSSQTLSDSVHSQQTSRSQLSLLSFPPCLLPASLLPDSRLKGREKVKSGACVVTSSNHQSATKWQELHQAVRSRRPAEGSCVLSWALLFALQKEYSTREQCSWAACLWYS